MSYAKNRVYRASSETDAAARRSSWQIRKEKRPYGNSFVFGVKMDRLIEQKLTAQNVKRR